MGVLCEEVQGESIVGRTDGDTAALFGGVPTDNVVFMAMPRSYSKTKPTL